MDGLRLEPRNIAEQRNNWLLIASNVALQFGRAGGSELTGGVNSGEDLTIRSNPDLDGLVTFELATEDVDIVDAGSAGATEQDWIEVNVGGNTGYVRVYATK